MTSAVATPALPPAAVVRKPLTVGEVLTDSRWTLLAAAVMFVVTYASTFRKLFQDWGLDENYSHGYIVPVVFVYLIWQRRGELAKAGAAPRWWGGLVVVAGLCQFALGRLAAENFIAHTSMLVVMAGATIFLFGIEMLRLVAFPIGWLLFMVPIPAIIFYSIMFPLQLVASSMAAATLDVLRIPNLREGNVIQLPHYSMGVVEACSGIRGLISLITIAVLLGHFREMKPWQRISLVVLAVPIELVVNAVRIAGTGVIGNYLGETYAEGFFHSFYGWLLFVISVTGLILCSVGLTWISKKAAAREAIA